MANVLVNGSIEAKRGVLAAFRKHLNELYANEPLYKNWQWHQVSRPYGDYLFHQDRPLFEEALWRAMQGRDFPGFDYQRWLP